MITTPTYVPRCPCGEPLEGIGFPLKAKGRGKCHGGRTRDYELEVDETILKKDKDGTIVPAKGWVVTEVGHQECTK